MRGAGTLIGGERSSGFVNRGILEKASRLRVSREERANVVLQGRVACARLSQEPVAVVRWTQQRRLEHLIDASPCVSHRYSQTTASDRATPWPCASRASLSPATREAAR
jgi:hypothetical protein